MPPVEPEPSPPPGERQMVGKMFGHKLGAHLAPSPYLVTCVTGDQRKRMAEVKKAEGDPTAFRPTAIWLPPVFMTDAERSYYWIALLYLRTYDFDAGTSTTVFPPFALSLCSPTSKTLVTPVYSERTDAEGTARLILAYFQRRDRLAQTDIFFPLVWSIREREDDTQPWNDETGLVIPFAAWRRKPDGRHWALVTPLFLNFGDADEDTTVVANIYHRKTRDSEDTGVVPFFFSGRSGNSRYTLIPPLAFYQGTDGDRTTTFVGPVYTHRAPDGVDFGVFPFYFGGRHPDRSYDVAPLVFWRWAGTDAHGWVIPPLLAAHWGSDDGENTWVLQTWYQSDKTGYDFTSFPIVFFERDGASNHQVIAPLFWRFEDPEKTTTVVGNVFLQQRKTGYDFGVAPLYFRGRDGDTGYDDLVPLFFTSHDGPKHRVAVPPALFAHWGDDESESTWALQTWYQSRRDGYSLVSLPFLFLGRDGPASHQVFAPLFWRFHDPEQTTTVVGNVFLHEKPTGYDFGVAPLYFRGREGDSGYDVSPPFFWRFQDPEQTTTVAANVFLHQKPTGYDFGVAPLYFRGREGDSGYDHLVPLFFSGHDGPNHHLVVPLALTAHWGDADSENTWSLQTYLQTRRDGGYHLVSFPVLFAGKDNDSEYEVMPPLLLGHWGDASSETIWALQSWYRSGPEGYSFASLPFVFAGKDAQSSYQVVAPLFWRFQNPEKTTTVVGPGYFARRPDGYDFGLAPLYFRGRDGARAYDISPLLFWNLEQPGSHLLVIPPALTARWSDGDSENTWALQTYYQKRKDGFRLVSLPLVFAAKDDESEYETVVPLFWHFKDAEKTTTVIGTGYLQQRKTGYDFGVAPLYFRGREADAHYDVSPPLFWSWGDAQSHHLFIPPLLTAHWGDGEGESTWALQTYYQRRRDGFTLVSLPFLFAGKDEQSEHEVVAPVFWRFKESEKTTTVVGPAFLQTRPTGYDFGIAPLYFRGRDAGARYDVSPLLFWSWGDAQSHHLLLPPLLAYHGGDGETETTYALQTYYQRRPHGFSLVSFPFVFASKDVLGEYEVVPPVFWRFKDLDKTTTVVGPVFLQERASSYDFGVAPLYFRGRDEQGGYDASPFLFWRWNDATSHHLVLPLLLTAHWGDADGEGTFALQTYYQARPDGFTLTSFPLVFAGAEGPSNYQVVAPLLWHFHDPDRDTVVAGPVFRHVDPEKTLFGVAPLYFGGRGKGWAWDFVPPLFYRHAGEHSQHLMVLPLFDYREDQDSRLFLSPIAVHSKDPQHERTVVGGLYWRMSGPDADAQVLFPLWWNVLNKGTGNRLTTVFPFYWRYQEASETTHVLINLMWSYGVGELGPKWSFHFFPLLDLASYHPGHFLWQILTGLIGREVQGDSARWRTFWVWNSPQKLTPEAPPPAQTPAPLGGPKAGF